MDVTRARASEGRDVQHPGAGRSSARLILGARLRRLREAAGVSPETACKTIRASRSKISRLELGRTGFKLRDVADLLTLYGVTDEAVRGHMLALAEHANSQGWWARYDDVMPDWFETYVGLEQATSLIRTYELQFVPGLFQTEDYAREVTLLGHRSAPAEEIERRVSLRIKRQQILASEAGPRVWAVWGSPVSGSVIISQLPWSAVTSIVMPCFCATCQRRPTHSSTTFTAFTAASSFPVCPTMSGFA